MYLYLRIIVALSFFSSLPADASRIEITYPEPDLVRAMLFELDAVDDRVYSIGFDQDGTARIGFGDGVPGSRPSSGGSVVASYRFGAGVDGSIFKEYEISRNEFPFIPITDFWPAGANQPDASFILAGLTSITLDFSPAGLRVVDAEPLPAFVPAPPALLLFLSGLIALAGFDKRRKAN